MRTGLAHDFAHDRAGDDFDRTFRRLQAHLRLASIQQIVPPQQAPAVIEQAPTVRQAWAHGVANLVYAGALLWHALRLTVRETPRLARAAFIRASRPAVCIGVIGWTYGLTLTALCIWR